jgi:hypothetical protein
LHLLQQPLLSLLLLVVAQQPVMLLPLLTHLDLLVREPLQLVLLTVVL